jgi:excinuclease UvrABC nuclease subunit
MNINVEFDSELNKSINFANDFDTLLEHYNNSIKNFKNYGIVYFIYVSNQRLENTELVYIGKSRGALFKTRINNHFKSKHEKTGSKLALIQREIKNGNEVRLKFIKTTPESYRNSLEEELIHHFLPNWNIQKRKN